MISFQFQKAVQWQVTVPLVMRVDVHLDLKQNAKMASVSVTDLPYIEKNMDSLFIMNSLQYLRLSMYFLSIKTNSISRTDWSCHEPKFVDI